MLQLVATFLILAAPASPVASQEVWFAPRGPDTRPVGAVDWDSLFKPNQEWMTVASRIQVFVITAGYVIEAGDDELRAAADDLDRHQIKLALSMQSIALIEGETCGYQEGYERAQDSATAAAKLLRLGIKLSYITLDEPLWFGHYDPAPTACHLPVREVIRRVSLSLGEYVRRYPDIKFGDIEPVPVLTMQGDWESSFREFIDGLKSAVGQPLAFLHTDVAWRVPSAALSVRAAAEFAHDLGLNFGVIYNGDGLDRSGKEWVADAVRHFERLESRGNVVPDEAIFSTWDQFPSRILPETSDDTLSSVLVRYGLKRTRLISDPQNVRRGRLITDDGRPVPGETIVLDALGLDLGEAVPVYLEAGTVPLNARFGIIMLNINTDCLCAGENDIAVGNFVYSETKNGSAYKVYSLPTEVSSRHGHFWSGAEARSIILNGVPAARVVVHPDQHFGINSTEFAVTSGADFEFKVAIGSIDGRGMFGNIGIVWLDEVHRVLFRTTVVIGEHEAIEVARTTTDAKGWFQFSLGQYRTLRNRDFQFDFMGNERLRAALSSRQHITETTP